VAGASVAAAAELRAPPLVASGVPIALEGTGAVPGERVTLELRGVREWGPIGDTAADAGGAFRLTYQPRRIRRRYLLRARLADGEPTAPIAVRSRDVTLAAVGDINLGDGVATVIAQRGPRYPWGGVAPVLSAADVAFGNLECSVSTRGRPVEKEFTFRGRPSALRVARDFAGLDVVNLANNHVGDYGTGALLDTLRHVRAAGLAGVGAGRDLAEARRPRVVTRLGLRIAFVGFSDIGPGSFAAGPDRPGTAFASLEAIKSGVRRAREEADVVIATFHWGVERARRENGRQRAFAAAALRAGAAAVIGAHPHVLQPLRRRGRTLVAYSLGNFVWAAGSPLTARTAILTLRLSTRGLEGSRLLPARIEQTRPRLLRGRRPSA
jgi:poly-gamma-glutamate capsule biosynthesis protein CapA/YwtB (metallophosphatase superfamily)